MRSAVRFRLPPELEATAPPEARGLRRDHVRLLVVDRADGSATHHRFHELPRLLAPGERLEFAGGLGATVLGRHEEARPLVWLAFDTAGERLAEALHRAGRPVRYAYVPRAWPLHHYQTLFAAGPGSAEMASAGRPFTVQTVRDLRRRGVGLATISLHAGLSTYGDPATDWRFVPAEPYFVPEATAAAVAATRAAGGRVIAVGTTVVRTLETAAQAPPLRAGPGVSRLRITPGFPLRVVDGLLTGLHEPEASHLDLLGAFLDAAALERAYAAALDAGYLWHEFGDVCLLLPRSS